MSGQLSRIQPILISFVTLVLAAALGYGWGVSSVKIENTGIWQLQITYQGIYVQAVADAYALDNNGGLAASRLSYICQANDGLNQAFQAARDFYGQAGPGRLENLARLQDAISTSEITPIEGVCSNRAIGGSMGMLRIIAPVLLFLMAAGIVGMGVLKMIRAGEEEAAAPPKPAYIPPASVMGAPAATPAATPAAAPPKPTAEEEERKKPTIFGKKEAAPVTLETAKSAAAAGAILSSQAEKTDFSTNPPIIQFMTTYLHGDDLYDDSFSIETAAGEFLGETGVSISETMDINGKKSVVALEVWLFDKNDIRTVTKVMMSDHAYNDESIRAKLAAKGDAILMKAGEKVTLETAAIKVQARMVDFAYGSGGPPNSFFERVTLELAAWKAGGAPG